MPRISKQYLDRVRALPWREVLPRLGITPPDAGEAATGFYMRCSGFRDGRQVRIEKTASLRFDRTGVFHCFSCGCHGDVFSFVLRHKATGGHRHDFRGLRGVEDLDGETPFERTARRGTKRGATDSPKAYRAAMAFFDEEFGIRNGARPLETGPTPSASPWLRPHAV